MREGRDHSPSQDLSPTAGDREGTQSPREQDVFRWAYREPGDDRQYGRYHCCSRIAVFSEGRLWDTFWSSKRDGRSFGVDDLPTLELTFLGNLTDFEKAGNGIDLYADADVMNLNHSNSSSGNLYIRKGAQRSAEAMLSTARERLRRAEEDERYAASQAEKLRAAIAQIEAGDTSVYL